MRPPPFPLFIVLVALLLSDVAGAAETVWIDSLDLGSIRQGWGRPRARRSVGGRALSIGGNTFSRGLGTHAESGFRLRLDGRARSFQAAVGVDDEIPKGRGRIEFVVIADGEPVWRSGPMRSGDPARRVRVDLARVRTLDLVVTDGEDGEDEDHADWADARVIIAGARPVPERFRHTLIVRTGRPRQTIHHFGASDCWSIRMLGVWSRESRERLADLLFSLRTGIGLSGWRFNVGAGPDRTITNPWRTSECFETAPGKYDWTRQAGQRWFLRAAKARGVSRFVAFANSPPMRMTRNGRTSCSDDSSTTNLKKGAEAAFARFLVDVAAHFARNEDPAERIEFDRISPVNEPQWAWTKRGQEGSRASNADLVRLYRALARGLEARGLRTRVLGPESGSMGGMLRANADRKKKLGADYGAYVDLFCEPAPGRKLLDGVLCGHSYWSDGYAALVSDRRALRRSLDRHPGWEYWQTEYCILRGPRGQSGWGRDLGMTTALWVARVIHLDLTVAEASAWSPSHPRRSSTCPAAPS
jgi:O-Glycosyl hydrolase family 30/NPCBM/NEW2 domain